MSKGLVLLHERFLNAEHQCALAIVKVQQDLQLFLEQQNALNQYRQIYHQQWTQQGLQGLSAEKNIQYHAFINKLERAIEQQSEGLLQIRQALAQRKREWSLAQQRRKAVEILLDKKVAREQLNALRQEQKMLDEYVMIRCHHQHNGDLY